MPDKLRVFVALPLPTIGIECLAGLQAQLKSRGLKMSWVRPRNLHLTMKFLGDIPADELDGLAAALRQTAAGRPPLTLVLQGLGVFPGIKRPRVLWTGLGGDIEALQAMFGDLENGMADLGFQKDKRVFRAHITIGRIRKPIEARHLLEAIEAVGRFEPFSFVADRLVLFKSDLKLTGAVYTPLVTCELT